MAMTNAEWMIQQGYKFSDVHVWYSCSKSDEFVVRIKEKKIDTFKSKLEFPETDEAFVEWLDMEHKEPILDDVEREYLSAVIKPFRDRVRHIKKVRFISYESEYQYIVIILRDVSYNLALPIFKADTMYKGMEQDKIYSIEDLGL